MTYSVSLNGFYRRQDGLLVSVPAVYNRSEIKGAVVKTPQHALRRTRPNVYLPPTPRSCSVTESKKMKGGYADKFGQSQVGYRNNFPSRALPGIDTSTIESKAINKALGSLKGQRVNYAQAFAERQQTANLVASTAARIGRAFNAVRHGKVQQAKDILLGTPRKQVRKTKRALQAAARARKKTSKARSAGSKAIGNTWLELQYGWKPLLSDVHGALEELHAQDSAEPNRYMVDARGSGKDRYKSYYSVLNSSIRETGYETADGGCFIHLTYKLRNPILATLADSGITNPANLAWELLPYSFVADWFVPVGAYLQTLDADVGYDFLGGSKTVRKETRVFNVRQTREGSVLGSLWYWEYSQGERYSKTVVRTVYASAPSGAKPHFKNPLSLHHMANALSLLQGMKNLK